MLSSRGAIIKGSMGWRVEWERVVCTPWFDRWGEAFAYLMALRNGIRLRMEARAGGWLICTGIAEDDLRKPLKKGEESPGRQFEASKDGISVDLYLSKRRSSPVVAEAYGKPQKPRRKAADALAAITGDDRDGRTPEERRAAYARTAKEAREARKRDKALERGTLASHYKQELERHEPEKPAIPELPAMFRKLNGRD